MGLFSTLFGITAMATKATVSASMFTGNALQQGFINVRSQRELKKMRENIAASNSQNRMVLVMPEVDQTQLCLTEAMQDTDVYECVYNGNNAAYDYIYGAAPQTEAMIVSGGDSIHRCKALEPFIKKSLREELPVVFLYTGDKEVEKTVGYINVNTEIVSKNDFYYDVFRGMTAEDVSDLLYDLYKELHSDSTKPAISYFLKALTEVIMNKNASVSVNDIANFPVNDFKKELDDLKKNDCLNTSEYKEIEQYYLSGLSESLDVMVFLRDLNRQFSMVFGNQSGNSCNVKRILNQKGIIAFNVGKTNNEMVVDLIVKHLKLCKMQNKDFNLVIDGIEVSKHENIKDLLKLCTFAISHNDYIASLYGGNKDGEHLFTEIMGDISVTVLLNHPSGVSCEKWSEYMGKYKKLHINYNTSQQNTGIMGSNVTNGISLEEKEEPRIRGETINHIRLPTACIYRTDEILIANL